MVTKTNVMEAVNKSSMYEVKELGQLNGNTLNVVQIRNRTPEYRVHQESDELFYVLEGHFTLDLVSEKTTLFPGDMVIVPKGTRHRPICTRLVKLLLIDMTGAPDRDNCAKTYSE